MKTRMSSMVTSTPSKWRSTQGAERIHRELRTELRARQKPADGGTDASIRHGHTSPAPGRVPATVGAIGLRSAQSPARLTRPRNRVWPNAHD